MTAEERTRVKAVWSEVEQELLERVFYAHDGADIRAAKDLAQEGMLDSLSIVATLEILVETTGNEDVLTQANASDFRNMASIRALYEKL